MLLPESMDVAAGLVFVYLFMSVLATIAREALEGFTKRRARNLEKGLIELLCDHPAASGSGGKNKFAAFDMLKSFYEHPLIMTLYRGNYKIPPKRNFSEGRKLPSYIPPEHFAYVVMDLLTAKGGQVAAGSIDLDSILSAAEQINNPRLSRMVQFAVQNSGGNIDKTRQFLENWFNATMDRVSGWYRLETQTILFWVSLVACVVLNVNTVVIADSLYRSPSLRKTVEAQAEAYYNSNPSAISSLPTAGTAGADATVTAMRKSGSLPGLANPTDPLSKLGLPLGWNRQTIDAMHRLFPTMPNMRTDEQEKVRSQAFKLGTKDISAWVQLKFAQVAALWQDTLDSYNSDQQDPAKNALFTLTGTLTLVMGWLMTAFAVTLGAPFWFDVLSKLMMVRSTLKPGSNGPNGSTVTNDIGSALSLALASTGGDSTRSLTPYQPSDNAAVAVANTGTNLLPSEVGRLRAD